MKTELVPAYHIARVLVIVCAGLIALWWFGVPFEGPLPLLGMRVAEADKVPYIVGVILAYGVFRLLISWTQSDPAWRRRSASRIDFSVTIVIAAVAGWALLTKLLPSFEPPSVSLFFSGAALMALGVGGGSLAYLCLENLLFIRSKEEAERLALPRFPVAVRATFKLGYFIVPPILVVFFLAPHFMPPLSNLWPWLLLVPTSVLLASGVISLLSRTHTLSDGIKVSRSEYIKRLRVVFDQHDTRYQIGGWDKPIRPHNAPLYIAAELDDIATVRQLLSDGADPDDRNMHGWTALMIAVAQQHEKTVQILLENGADPNLSNLLGRNALMFAARYGNVGFVRQLIQHGAQVNLDESSDPENRNVLSAAAEQGHEKVVQLLLEAGADPTIRNRAGNSAKDYAQAAGHGEIAAILRRAELDARS